MPLNVKKLTKRLVGILAWLVGGVIVLLIVVFILIQLPAVQNFAKQRIVVYLQKKVGTRVEIGRLRIIFPKQILLENVYFGDQHKDTLFSGRRIQVDISLFSLLHKEINVSYIGLEGVRANVYRLNPDTVFNYAYILKAFAGAPDTTHSTDTSGGFTFAVGAIHLQDIMATYRDDATGNDVYLDLGNFTTHIKTFDPAHSVYTVPDIDLSAVTARVRQFKPLMVLTSASGSASASSSAPIRLTLGSITLEHIAADYSGEPTLTRASLRLGNLKVQTDSLSLSRSAFAFKDIDLDSTDLQYDNDSTKRLARGLDNHHLKVTGLLLRADHIGIAPSAYAANITSINLHEQSGLHIRKFTGGFVYNDHEAHIKGLDIQTDYSEIRNETDAAYPSVDTLSKHIGLLYLDTRMIHSTINTRDVLLLVPSLAAQLKGYEASPLTLNGQVKGRVNALRIPLLELAGLRRTAISLKGTIKGLPDAQKAFYDLTILRLNTGRQDIAALVPPKALPSNIQVPETISATGTFRGTVNAFEAFLNARTSNGNAVIRGTMNLNAKTYAANITLDQLDLGYILKQPQNVGKISLKATAAGNGFSYPGLNTDIQAQLSDGTIKGYDYRDLVLKGSFHEGHGVLHSQVKDPEISYLMDLEADVTKGRPFPALKGTIQVDTADLHALHLVTDTLQLKGLVHMDFSSTNPDSLQGTLSLLHWAIDNNGRRLNADSIALVAAHPGDSQYIHLWSDMALLDLDGVYRLTDVPGALAQTIDHYYALTGTGAVGAPAATPGAHPVARQHSGAPHHTPAAPAPQSWKLHLLIKPSPLLLSFVPALKGTDTLGIQASFNSAQNDLRMTVRTPKLLYGADTVYKLDLAAATGTKGANELDYRLQTDKAMIGAFPLNRTIVAGHLADNKLFTTVTLKDPDAKDWYRVAASIAQGHTTAADGTQSPNGWTLSLNPDSLLLNHTAWTVSSDNSIHYDSTGIIARDFQISHAGQSMEINSVTPEASAPIELTFKDFHLSAMTAAAGQDSLPADGILNGTAQVTHVMSGPVFTSDLTIKDLSYQKDTVGDLTLKVDNQQTDTYTADISLEGHKSDLTIKGTYHTGDGKMDLNLHLGALNLAAAKPFAAGQLNDIKGTLKGDMHITGTAAKPVPDGNLHFVDAVITPNITDEPLKLSNDNIEFDNTGFNFSEFAILDSAGNKATVDGNVYTTDYRNYKFDMTFNANNFRLVNAPQASDRMFYGKLNIDAAVNLEGDPGSPKVDGDLRVNKKTDFTFVLPENDPEVVSREGVVRFVDKNNPGDTISAKMALDSITALAPMKGMNISANIETDSSANFTMIIDQRNGDAIKVRGRSSLNFGMDESGKTTLTGNYEISAGSYSLTLDVLKRVFNIQRGSTITWTGDPTSAQLNLTALYLASAPPIDLVEDELAGSSAAETNKYKQKLPFMVSLMMKGEILKPIITFDINLPNNLLLLWPEVDTKLQQVRSDPSELNKQVFALLLLGRFVGDNPLESGAGGTSVAQMAFQSASQILTGELNQLAGSLIKGVDVSFDLNNTQDYSTGQEQDQTDLGVTVSKRLFNDRIKVNVGSDFELAGTLPGQNASNIGGDLSVDYELTKDGRYMLRAYRKNQYDVVVEGEVIETGLSFILTLDYNKFRELFGKYFEQKLQARKLTHGS